MYHMILSPDSRSIVIITRYYSYLAANLSYKRRVSRLLSNSSDDTVSNVAVFEYFGQHVQGTSHGNTKRPTDNDIYTRMPAATMTKINKLLTNRSVKETYNPLITNDDVATAPCDSKVVCNVKAAVRRETNRTRGRQHCQSFADEVHAVTNMAQNDDFVPAVVINRNRVPSVILYTEQQLRDPRSFCFDRSHGSVLRFDKT